MEVVKQIGTETLDSPPRSAILTSRDELLLLRGPVKITVSQIVPVFKDIFHILLDNFWDIYHIDYIEDSDALILLCSNTERKYVVLLLLNWRVGTKGTNFSIVPKEAIRPNRWLFPKVDRETVYSLELASFENEFEPEVQVCGKAICIMTQSSCIIWDMNDKTPVLRTVLLMPQPVQPDMFSFHDDRLAVVLKDRLCVIRLVEASDERTSLENETFSPGSKCLNLDGQNLVIDFGVCETRSSLFVPRSLPHRHFLVETLIQFQPPDRLVHIKFVTANRLFALSHGTTFSWTRSSDGDFYEICPPVAVNGENNAIYENRAFMMFYNRDKFMCFPNPNCYPKGMVVQQVLSEFTVENTELVCVNDRYCVVITGALEDGVVNLFKFESTERCKSTVKVNQICLKALNNEDYSQDAYEVGMDFVKTPANRRNGVTLLIEAFNYGVHRKEIIQQILQLSKHDFLRRVFIENAKFTAEDLEGELLEEIVFLAKNGANEQVQLLASVSAVKLGKLEEAERMLPKSHDLLRSLHISLLTILSKALAPSVLIEIGHPELPNDKWTDKERQAAWEYFQCSVGKGDILDVLRTTSTALTETWHCTEWPSPPALPDWIDGQLLQFVAGCCTRFTVAKAPPPFEELAAGIQAAKDGCFKTSIEILSGKINVCRFLDSFAEGPSAWIEIMRQIDDRKIQNWAIYRFLAESPSSAYNLSLEKVEDEHLKEITDRIGRCNQELIQLCPGPRYIMIS